MRLLGFDATPEEHQRPLLRSLARTLDCKPGLAYARTPSKHHERSAAGKRFLYRGANLCALGFASNEGGLLRERERKKRRLLVPSGAADQRPPIDQLTSRYAGTYCRNPGRGCAELPFDRVTRAGIVETKGSGLDGPGQHFAQCGVIPEDFFERAFDCPSHAQSRPFRGRCRPTFASAEPDRSGELTFERIDLILGGFRALDVATLFRLFEFFAKLYKSAAVLGLALSVEHGASVAQSPCLKLQRLAPGPTRRFRRRLGFRVPHRVDDPSNQVERMELGTWVAEQIDDVAEAFGVSEMDEFVAIGERPELALLTKYPFRNPAIGTPHLGGITEVVARNDVIPLWHRIQPAGESELRCARQTVIWAEHYP